MPTFSDLYGGYTLDNLIALGADPASVQARAEGQHGVFGKHPLATPKYALNQGSRDAEYRDTLARLYIQLPSTGNPNQDEGLKRAYINSLPEESRALGNVLLGTNGGTGFVDFFLAQANESFEEIVQVDKVMADDYVAFFFGQQPPRFQYSGTLLNSLQDDQRGSFARAYNLMLRGTQLARRGALARLRYDSVIVNGMLMGHQQALNSDNEMAVPFSFTFLVKDYVVLDADPFFSKKSVSQYVALSETVLTEAQSIGAPVRGGRTSVTGVVDVRLVAPAQEEKTSLEQKDESARETAVDPEVQKALDTQDNILRKMGAFDPPPEPTAPLEVFLVPAL